MRDLNLDELEQVYGAGGGGRCGCGDSPRPPHGSKSHKSKSHKSKSHKSKSHKKSKSKKHSFKCH